MTDSGGRLRQPSGCWAVRVTVATCGDLRLVDLREPDGRNGGGHGSTRQRCGTGAGLDRADARDPGRRSSGRRPGVGV